MYQQHTLYTPNYNRLAPNWTFALKSWQKVTLTNIMSIVIRHTELADLCYTLKQHLFLSHVNKFLRFNDSMQLRANLLLIAMSCHLMSHTVC
jgi:hypothetical protein